MLNNAGKLKQRDTKLTRCVNLKGMVSKERSQLPLIHHKPYYWHTEIQKSIQARSPGCNT